MSVLIRFGDFYEVSNLPREKFSCLRNTFFLRVLGVEAYNAEARRCALTIQSVYNQTQHEDCGFSESALIFKNTRKCTENNIISVINPVITSFTNRFNVF